MEKDEIEQRYLFLGNGSICWSGVCFKSGAFQIRGVTSVNFSKMNPEYYVVGNKSMGVFEETNILEDVTFDQVGVMLESGELVGVLPREKFKFVSGGKVLDVLIPFNEDHEYVFLVDKGGKFMLISESYLDPLITLDSHVMKWISLRKPRYGSGVWIRV